MRSLPRTGHLVTIAAAITVLLVVPAAAHYPLLELRAAGLRSGIVEAGEPLTLSMAYGHPFMNDRHSVPDPTRVRVCVSVSGRVPKDVTARVTTSTAAGVTRWHLRYTPRREGDYVFGWECGRFEEGQRRVRDFAKLVLHARHGQGAQVGWDRSFKHPLEILPLTRPYALPIGSAFRAQVVTHSEVKGQDRGPKPFANGLIEAETSPFLPGRDDDLPNVRLSVKADANGVFVISLPREGWWMLSCATDGGPGEQGTSPVMQKRAVLWLYVGGTVYDDRDPQPALGNKLAMTPMTLKFDGTFGDALKALTQALGVPVTAYGIEGKRRVSVRAKDLSQAQVLDQVASQLRAAWRRDGEGVEFFMP